MDLIEAEIVKPKKFNIPFVLIVAIVVLLGSLYGSFKLGQASVEPVVKIKKVAVNQDGKQWFTINETIDNLDTPDDWKDADLYDGFINKKNGMFYGRRFIGVTHIQRGCSGKLVNVPEKGMIYCTDDWIIKLREEIPEDVLEKYKHEFDGVI
jgi:hypothetical protein